MQFIVPQRTANVSPLLFGDDLEQVCPTRVGFAGDFVLSVTTNPELRHTIGMGRSTTDGSELANEESVSDD